MATFSITDRQTFRRCRRMWDYSSNARQNLTPIGSGPEPLELGGLIHRALADWIKLFIEAENEAKRENMLLALFIKNAGDRQKELTESYQERTGKKIPDSYLESLHNVVRLGMSMMINYQAFHKTPIPKHMSFAAPEQEILVPVPGTEKRCKKCFDIAYEKNLVTVLYADHITLENNLKFPARPDCEDCNGTGIVQDFQSGTLDGLLQDERGRLYVLEHKTYENRPHLIDLNMNDQFTGYAWMVSQLGIGQVAGIAYDGMWKRAEVPTKVKDQTTGKYRPGKMDDLFIQKVLTKSEMQINEWGRQNTKMIKDMANNPEIYPNVPWSGCSDCSFRKICQMQMHGDDPTNLLRLEYTQREIVRGGK